MYQFKTKDEIIKAAIDMVCETQFTLKNSSQMDPSRLIKFLQLNHEQTPNETFSICFLDAKCRLITHEVLFKGSITATEIHIRVVAQKALELNSCSIVLCHHHPLGCPEPSSSDKLITSKISEALNIFDIRVLDHIILAANDSYSFVENDLI